MKMKFRNDYRFILVLVDELQTEKIPIANLKKKSEFNSIKNRLVL